MFQVLGFERANSTEFDEQTPDPVVIFMPEVYISSCSFYFSYICHMHAGLYYFLFDVSGLKNTYGKHNETRISKNTISDP